MTLKFDSRHLPRSLHEWEQLVLACGVQDDTIETHWLERKGPLQLGTPRDKFAVAKAILAFANRDPAAADPFLDGHALVLIGIEKTGEITGVPRIEDHQLINALRAYLGNGDDAPRWVIHRRRVDDDKDVVIIDVDAPRPGDPIFTLRKAYDRFLAGSIFSRSSTESAPADPSAVATLSRRLIARERGGFEVEVSLNEDAISSYTYDPGFIEPLLAQTVGRYIADAEKMVEPARFADAGSFPGTLYLPSGIRHEENRSREGFRQETEDWATDLRQQLPVFAKHVISFARPAAQFTIANTCGRYLEDLEVEIHIEGDVFQQPKPMDEDDIANSLPARPRAWGPWESPLDYIGTSPNLPSALGGVLPLRRPNSTDFRNSGSVTAVLSCRELRPGRSHTFTADDDHVDITLLTSNTGMATARITVTATARGIDASHTAELIQPVTPVGDITSMLVAFLEALDYFKVTPSERSR